MNKITEIKKLIIPILKKHGVKKAALFGSVAHGDAKKNSDVDILVEIKKNISLLDFIEIKLHLEGALKKKVDLVEYQMIKPAIKKSILENQVPIL